MVFWVRARRQVVLVYTVRAKTLAYTVSVPIQAFPARGRAPACWERSLARMGSGVFGGTLWAGRDLRQACLEPQRIIMPVISLTRAQHLRRYLLRTPIRASEMKFSMRTWQMSKPLRSLETRDAAAMDCSLSPSNSDKT